MVKLDALPCLYFPFPDTNATTAASAVVTAKEGFGYVALSSSRSSNVDACGVVDVCVCSTFLTISISAS